MARCAQSLDCKKNVGQAAAIFMILLGRPGLVPSTANTHVRNSVKQHLQF
jgi:hypothetical protein